jgi:flagellar hook-associated protein 2
LATSSTATTILSVGTTADGLPTLPNTLSGGIDVQSAVNSAMAAMEIPQQLLQQQQSKLQSQVSTLNQVSTDLSSLLTTVNSLKDPFGGLNAMTTTSSDTSVVTASASSGLQAGNHTVVVNSLAATSSYYSAELASSSTTFTAGNVTLKIGSNSAVTIPATGTVNTLAGLATAINNAGAGVSASVITDTLGSRLAIVSNSSGAAGDISVTGNTTGLALTKSVTGADASVVVDGVPVTSATNSVSNAIPGLTFNLQNANPKETVSIGVAADTSQATSAIQAFVSAYNKVIGDINAQAATGSSSTSVLQGDSTMRDIQQRVLTDVTTSLTGNGGLSNLESIGVSMQNDGTLSINSSALTNSLSTNFNGVQNLFQNASGVATTFSNDLYSITDLTQGEVALAIKGDNSTIASLGQSISDYSVRLTSQQTLLTNEFNTINTTLQELPILQQQTAAQLTNIP